MNKKDAGFTLVEALASLAIFSFAILVMFETILLPLRTVDTIERGTHCILLGNSILEEARQILANNFNENLEDRIDIPDGYTVTIDNVDVTRHVTGNAIDTGLLRRLIVTVRDNQEQKEFRFCTYVVND